jgi:hypothetical protein
VIKCRQLCIEEQKERLVALARNGRCSCINVVVAKELSIRPDGEQVLVCSTQLGFEYVV